jgi:hypothetical protein
LLAVAAGFSLASLVFAFHAAVPVAEFHQAIIQMEFHVLILPGVLPNESELHPTNVRQRQEKIKRQEVTADNTN